jgi:cytochrome c oxidase assembly protein subunit 15
MPVGIFTLATFVMSFWVKRGRGLVIGAALAAVVLVGINAWLGKNVVETGLKPGIITLHMALAILLLCVQVYIVFAGGERRPTIALPGRWAWGLGLVLFLAVAAEGVMGSQVREMTDTLAKEHQHVPRSEWAGELEQTWVYLAHRSFSWIVLGFGIAFFWQARGLSGDFARGSRGVMCGVVLAQMVLGVMMAHVSVYPAVQVLHIGLSSVFVASGTWFLLAGWEARRPRLG